MGRITARTRVTRITVGGPTSRREDLLAVEEPLEIRVGGMPLAVTMRTPGHDVELAHGFLLTEGVITAADHLVSARYCDSVDDTGANTYNVLDVALAPGVAPPEVGVERNFYTTSSCGVCGKASLDAVRRRSRFPPAGDTARVEDATLYGLPDALRAAQPSTLSTALCRPSSSRTTSGAPPAVNKPAPCSPPVESNTRWAARSASGRP